jgi:hypothetical protein
MVSPARNDRTGSPKIDAACPAQVRIPTATQRISRSTALALYQRELAFYRADEPHLPVEKCAERCAKLSLLLTQAQVA